MVKKRKPVLPDEHCNAETRAGTLCRRKAGFGTDHVGTGRCKNHGGVVGKNHGPPKGSKNAQKHGIYARLFEPEELDAAADMAGSLDTELAIARLQLANLIKEMQANQFELTKLEVKTLAMESPEQHEDKIKAARAKDAERCGEYYDPEDDDFGLEQESQPVEVKRTRERPDWRTEFIRLTTLIAKLEKQRSSIAKDKVIIAQVEKSNVANELNQMTDDELDRQLLTLITGRANLTVSEDESYGQT